MPIIDHQKYNARLIFKNGHINTMYPYLFRKKSIIPFIRERIATLDHDFFDVDWWKTGRTKKLIILLHGLEGSSASQYINGMSRIMHHNDYDVATINFRSCSGEINLKPEMYHSGYTKDLHYFISTKTSEYKEIFLCGFSLGGNVVMKYASDLQNTLSSKIKAIAGISVPCDLKGGSILLKKWYNHLYEQNFLKSLILKVTEKQKSMPEHIDLSHVKKIKSLWDFDDYYTSSLHGFVDGEDYYQQCSLTKTLQNIDIPAIIINAKDDSFLPDGAYPYDLARDHKYLHLMTPDHGGHVGFATFGSKFYWSEIQILDFFKLNTDSSVLVK